MRLDLFLKTSRLVIRRTLAQELCDAGRVKVNGAAAKSSKEVKEKDQIEIRRRGRILTARVLQIPEKKQVSRAGAADLYTIEREEEDPAAKAIDLLPPD